MVRDGLKVVGGFFVCFFESAVTNGRFMITDWLKAGWRSCEVLKSYGR